MWFVNQVGVSIPETRHLYGLPRSWIRRRKWQPTPVLLPGESHGWRSLVGYSPWGRKESDTAERLHFHFSIYVKPSLLIYPSPFIPLETISLFSTSVTLFQFYK